MPPATIHSEPLAQRPTRQRITSVGQPIDLNAGRGPTLWCTGPYDRASITTWTLELGADDPGNDAAYRRLLEWYQLWTVDLDRLGVAATEDLVAGVLALPAGEAFWDKVFEVWCLGFVAQALEHSRGHGSKGLGPCIGLAVSFTVIGCRMAAA